MRRVSFKVSNITPIIYGGKDKTKAELRPPSIKGLMRKWYRALLANYLSSSKELFEIEEKLFGSTNLNSPFKISVKSWVPKEVRGNKILPDTNFEVSLHFVRDEEAYIENILASFWMLINLGNIGFHQRWGYGSLKIMSMKSDIKITKINFKQDGNLEKFIQDNLLQIEELIKKNLENEILSKNEKHLQHVARLKEVYLCGIKNGENFTTIRDKIRSVYKKHRDNKKCNKDKKRLVCPPSNIMIKMWNAKNFGLIVFDYQNKTINDIENLIREIAQEREVKRIWPK